mgnify:CR=1 FL=1
MSATTAVEMPEIGATGLTPKEVVQRIESGQSNAVKTSTSRSVQDIVRANVFTLFNGIIFAAMVLVLITGSWRDAVFGFVIIINTGIGWHEARIPTIATMVPRAAFAWVTQRLMGEVKIPLIATNRINTPEVAESVLASGCADMVSMARPFLADPAFVRDFTELYAYYKEARLLQLLVKRHFGEQQLGTLFGHSLLLRIGRGGSLARHRGSSLSRTVAGVMEVSSSLRFGTADWR